MGYGHFGRHFVGSHFSISSHIYYIMSDLYAAAKDGDLERVQVLVEQGADKEKGRYGETPLYIATKYGHLTIVRYLAEQGAEMEKANFDGQTPLFWASYLGQLEIVRYLLEQGANTNKASNNGWTTLHWAACRGHLEIAKLLMAYGADLNSRDRDGLLPIDVAGHNTEEIRQAIRDEPERRWNQQPRKRCIEQDRQPHAAASAFAQKQEDYDKGEQGDKKQPAEGEVEEGKVADEDQDSEPSSDEEDGN